MPLIDITHASCGLLTHRGRILFLPGGRVQTRGLRRRRFRAYRSHFGDVEHSFESLAAASHALRLVGLRLGAEIDARTWRIEFMEPLALPDVRSRGPEAVLKVASVLFARRFPHRISGSPPGASSRRSG
jgi:hypothetical protein